MVRKSHQVEGALNRGRWEPASKHSDRLGKLAPICDATLMLIRSSRGLSDFGTSVGWGCFVGGLGIALFNYDLPSLDKWWFIPGIAFFYAVFASPFAAIGLALVGIPAADALRPYARHWWMAVLAAVLGAIIGELAFFLLKQIVFAPLDKLKGLPGSLVGTPTALIWWWLRRPAAPSTI